MDTAKPMFNGGDLKALFLKDGKPLEVSIENITWTVSIEEVEEPTLLRRKKKAKRAIVGSFIVSVYNEDPVTKFITENIMAPGLIEIRLGGTNKAKQSAHCILEGVKLMQSTFGWSMFDMSNHMGVSFVATDVVPWRPGKLPA